MGHAIKEFVGKANNKAVSMIRFVMWELSLFLL